MNRELDLRKTIGLSLLVHGMALFLFQVKIESLQPIISYQSYRVSFLGTILDDYSFKIVPVGEIKLEHRAKSWFPAKALTPDPIAAEQRTSQGAPILQQPTPMELSWNTEVSYQKPLLTAGRDIHVLKVHESPFVVLEGEIKERIVLFQPNAGDYFKNNENLPDLINMSFRLTVAQNGIVQHVEPILSSGRTELDTLGMSYVRQWKFVPREVKQLGILKIHFSRKL